MGPSWITCGSVWAHLRASSPILARSWPDLGSSWAHFGSSWGYLDHPGPCQMLSRPALKTCEKLNSLQIFRISAHLRPLLDHLWLILDSFALTSVDLCFILGLSCLILVLFIALDSLKNASWSQNLRNIAQKSCQNGPQKMLESCLQSSRPRSKN